MMLYRNLGGSRDIGVLKKYTKVMESLAVTLDIFQGEKDYIREIYSQFDILKGSLRS